MPRVPIERPPNFTNCYGCGADNARGLALSFFREDDAVVATFIPSSEHGGYGRLLHGGVTATLIDEAFGWGLYSLLGKIGITTTLTIEFSGRLLCGEPITVSGTIVTSDDKEAELRAVLTDARGAVAATGTGRMRYVSQRAIERIGNFQG